NQGEYGLMQCSKHCHQQTSQNRALMKEMFRMQANKQVHENLIPYCSECSAQLEINKRTEEKRIVEDEQFHAQKSRYETFLNKHKQRKVLYLENGVGHTTPQFIKHPLQKKTSENPAVLFVTINQKRYFIPKRIREQTVRIDEDIEA